MDNTAAMYALVNDVYFVPPSANKPFQILAQLLILSDPFQIALAVGRRAPVALFNELISIFTSQGGER